MIFGLTSKNNLFCLDAQSGKTIWIDQNQTGGRGFGSIIDVGSGLLALSNNSELVAFWSSSTEYSEITRFKVADTPTYAHPVASGDRIYVKDAEALTMWTIR